MASRGGARSPRRCRSCASATPPTSIVANGENSAGGLGITERTATAILDAGVDVITTGNHVYRHRDVYAYLDGTDRVVRPANYLDSNPGRGHTVVENARRALGDRQPERHRLPGAPRARPFHAVDELLSELERQDATWSSSTSMPRRRARRWRWAGTSTAACSP